MSERSHYRDWAEGRVHEDEQIANAVNHDPAALRALRNDPELVAWIRAMHIDDDTEVS